eukprot:scaffold15707_cov94-Skeletonema_dohrnii-CCMP3373.AAC.4
MRRGNFSYLGKLKYFAKNIRGCDSFWGKTAELESWIDYHIGRGHGPPTHFITLSCAEGSSKGRGGPGAPGWQS